MTALRVWMRWLFAIALFIFSVGAYLFLWHFRFFRNPPVAGTVAIVLAVLVGNAALVVKSIITTAWKAIFASSARAAAGHQED